MPMFAATVRSWPGSPPSERAQRALEAGFEKLALLAPLFQAELEAIRVLLPRERVCLLDLTVPYPRGARPGDPCPFRLGSTDLDDRRAAVRQGVEALELADDLAAPFVLFPALRLDPELATAEEKLRTRRHVAGLLDSVLGSRKAAARPLLDAIRGLLSKVLDAASRYPVRVALATGRGIGFLPDPLEAVELLREFRGGPLDIWADTASLALWKEIRATASSPARPTRPAAWPRSVPLEAAPRAADPPVETGIPGWQDLRASVAGLTLSDLDEDWEARDPGHGRIDWKTLRPVLDAAPIWVLDPAAEAGEEGLRKGLELAERLARPAPAGPERIFP